MYPTSRCKGVGTYQVQHSSTVGGMTQDTTPPGPIFNASLFHDEEGVVLVFDKRYVFGKLSIYLYLGKTDGSNAIAIFDDATVCCCGASDL